MMKKCIGDVELLYFLLYDEEQRCEQVYLLYGQGIVALWM